jgi:hypothetical protein
MRGIARMKRIMNKTWKSVDLRFRSGQLKARKSFHRLFCHGLTDKQIIFVLGFQRSGTNMLVNSFDKSLEVDVHNESDKLAFESYRLRSKEIIATLISRSTASYIIFKPICDSHRILELLTDYYGSKGIWIYRNYHDVANSAVVKWKNHAFEVIRDTVLGKMVWGWRQEAISQDTLTKIRSVWRPDISSHEAFLLFWYQRNQVFFDLELDKNPSLLPIRYEDLVTKPLQFFPKVFEFIGLPYTKNQISDVFATSVRAQQFPGAHPDIIKLCDEILERLDQAAGA